MVAIARSPDAAAHLSRWEAGDALGRTPRLVAIGNSHLDALRFAATPWCSLAAFGFEVDYLSTFDPLYQPFWRRRDSVWITNARFLEDAEDLLWRMKPDIVAAFVSGLFQFTHGTYGDERPFDFVSPSTPRLGLLPGREIIPYELVRESARRQYLLWPQLLAQIVAWAAPARVYAVSPPPPVEEFAPFHEQIKEQAALRGFQPDSLRYKMWRVQIEVERESAESQGARFLAPPRQAQNELGLRRVAFAHDILHGNAAYGALLGDQLRICLPRNRAEAGS